MVNIEVQIINAIIRYLKEHKIINTKDLEDRFYSIRELYMHRMILFRIICYTYPELSFKTKQHFDGSMFNDSFLTWIETPLGNASYHFKSKFYNEFSLNEKEKGPVYDGCTPDDVIYRINSLPIIKINNIDNSNSTIINCENEIYNLLELEEKDILKNKKIIIKVLNNFINLSRKMHLIKTIDINEGHHTLKELYKQKRELFKLICHNYSIIAWKSKYDINGIPISKETFIAGLNTPLGPVCYILNNEHYDEFKISALSRAPISKDDVHIDVIKKLNSIKIKKNNCN